MNATLHTIKPAAPKSSTPTRKQRSAHKALRRQAGTAVGVGAVAVTLTTLSLSHLARGIEPTIMPAPKRRLDTSERGGVPGFLDRRPGGAS
jgi:hypothetical protein